MRCRTVWLKKAGWILLTAVLCTLAVLEIQYPADEIVIVSEDAERILRRMPEAEITEWDRELLDTLLQCSAVQALLKNRETGDLTGRENSELTSAAAEFLGPEAAETVSVTVLASGESGSPVFICGWNSSEKEMSMVQRTERDGTLEFYKIYARKGLTGRRRVYSNTDNRHIQETTTRRRWLAYFRGRIWEDP